MDIHKVIGKLPRPKKGFVLPYHKYTGPYNPLHKQLDEFDRPLPGQEPYNAVDRIAMHHDICYRDNDTKHGKQKCDDSMLSELDSLNPKGIRERIDRRLTRAIIGTKRKLGMGIIEWSNELADELHKPIRKKFLKRRVYAKGVDSIWAADLVEMQNISKKNKGFRYILMIIDVFSKYGWAIPLKAKSAVNVTQAFKKLWETEPIPEKLWTDKGSEFYNKQMTKLLQEKNVELYSTENEEKSCVVERWNRTIKRNMWKYFSANNTHTYIDILPELIKKYNNTYHRSIQCTPTFAREPSSYQHVFNALYPHPKKDDKNEKKRKKSILKFKVGDHVRITKRKGVFEKGYTPNWMEEVFIIKTAKPTSPLTYTLEDLNGEAVKGSFYQQELQKSKVDSDTEYRIERVVRKRTKKDGTKEAYVKWKGYSSDFNSWIPAAGIVDLKK